MIMDVARKCQSTGTQPTSRRVACFNYFHPQAMRGQYDSRRQAIGTGSDDNRVKGSS